MRRTARNLWLSIGFVGLLVVGSIAAFAVGVRPVLGLDLEGGVSVILSAPEGTPGAVMERALENIRNRVDAFGVGEPLLFLSGTTIEAQLPGLARGTIEERPKLQHCLAGGDILFECFSSEDEARSRLDDASVERTVSEVCLTGLEGFALPCFQDRTTAQTALNSARVVESGEQFCFSGSGFPSDMCFETERAAERAKDEIQLEEGYRYCVTSPGGSLLAGPAGPACYAQEAEAEGVLASLSVDRKTAEFCVLSSAGTDLGCFLSRDEAEAKLQETGQERLLQVIGTTARLEQREVLQVIDVGTPEFAATPVTCGTPEERDSETCTFDALEDQTVVFLGKEGEKYRLGPVEITGDMIRRATAVLDTGSQTSVGTGWQIDFTLTEGGASTFAEVTERLVGRQLAIIVDNVVVSAPTVQDAITGGNGVITGSFTRTRAQDLATQLNAGALPVNLKKEQVQTVSPTLGRESLRQGLVAGIAGLVLLAVYLLFYYRLLGVVAWFGMTIWAIMAIALVSIAGRAFGYALTLAGVAGLVISLGVTADSYIVFFERLKDEVRHGKTPRAAVQPAFKRAYKTIVAADIVTALAAIILYLTAISSVRGFALTLGVATLLDLFVVYFFKRPTVFLIARSDRLVNLPGFGLTSGVAAEPLPGEPVPVAGGSR